MIDCPIFSPEEELSLAKRGLAGDVDARNQVLLGIYPLILREANRISQRRGNGMEAHDLANTGMLHAVRMFQTFDPSLGFRLSSYLMCGCARHMDAWAFNRDRTVCLPFSSHAFNYRGRKAETDKARQQGCRSLSDRLASDSHDDMKELGDLIPDQREIPPDAAASLIELHEQVHARLKKLHADHRKLVAMRLEGLSDAAIASSLGLTRQRIHQKFQKINAKLREIMRDLDPGRPVAE